MAIYFKAIINAGIDECIVQMSSNTCSNKRFDMVKYAEVFHQWNTDKINIRIPVQIFINDKTQVINNLNPPYRHVVCFSAVKIISHWFILYME